MIYFFCESYFGWHLMSLLDSRDDRKLVFGEVGTTCNKSLCWDAKQVVVNGLNPLAIQCNVMRLSVCNLTFFASAWNRKT